MDGGQLRELRAPQRRHTEALGNRLTRRRQPREVTQQVALGQRRRRHAAGNRAERKVEERRGQMRVEALVGTDVAFQTRESEEGRPAHEPARAAYAAAQVRRIHGILLRRVEDQGEERAAGVAGEVRAVRRPHHAVAHAIRELELHRDERVVLLRTIVPVAVGEHAVHSWTRPPAAAGTRAG